MKKRRTAVLIGIFVGFLLFVLATGIKLTKVKDDKSEDEDFVDKEIEEEF